MNQKVLIIGASSYVGARIYYELKEKYNVIGTYNTSNISNKLIKLNLQKTSDIKKIILSTKPDIIIHVANISSAKFCEENPEIAKSVNVDATKIIVDQIKHSSTKLIYISTMSLAMLYGKTKADSEQIIKNNLSNYVILRPFFILGYSPNTDHDRPFNRLLRNMDQHTPAVYDNSWNMQPTYLKHIAKIIIECIERDIKRETIPITVPVQKTRFEVAKDILSPFGFAVTPIDNHDQSVTFTDDSSVLKRLELPYSYEEMIKCIVDEIKHREKFKI